MSDLRFEHVTKVYGTGPGRVRALDDLCLSITTGETVAVVGASGSGKTTLLNLAAGLDRPTDGDVSLGDFPVSRMRETALARMRRRHVGFLFQAMNLVPTLCAGENIALAQELAGYPRQHRDRRVADLLARAGLTDRAGSFVEELSAGQAQRIAALRAVAHRPAVLLMDEPTSCLDTDNAETLMDLLLALNTAEGTTMVIATHDLRMARRMRRVVQLRDGKIIDDATP